VAERDVFINCPFDAEYQPLFEALIFTIAASQFKVRCALEDANGANVRLAKIAGLIADSPRSIHDLSRTQVSSGGLPRFNMPFELGMFIGAKTFGGPHHAGKSALVLVNERYVLPAYLSDLGGNDP
jgi:hypothetical protein